MSATAHQKALDGYYDQHANAPEEWMAKHAEGAKDNMRLSYGIDLYCRKHRSNHRFDAREVEQLVASLFAAWSDAVVDHTQDVGVKVAEGPRWTADEVLEQCPMEWHDTASDGEVYREHIENTVESRVAAALHVPAAGNWSPEMDEAAVARVDEAAEAYEAARDA